MQPFIQDVQSIFQQVTWLPSKLSVFCCDLWELEKLKNLEKAGLYAASSYKKVSLQHEFMHACTTCNSSSFLYCLVAALCLL